MRPDAIPARFLVAVAVLEADFEPHAPSKSAHAKTIAADLTIRA
jgi:hypothetical protein